MATTCGGCGAETSRSKTICRGTELIEFCPQCKPEEFQRWVDPSNQHGGFRYQYEPQKYTKRVNKDGSILYEATDERNADLEADLAAGPENERKRIEAAKERKRHNRRTTPLASSEADALATRARNLLQPKSPLSI